MWERERGGGNENADVGTRTWRWERGRGGGALWRAGSTQFPRSTSRRRKRRLRAHSHGSTSSLPFAPFSLAPFSLSLSRARRRSLRVGIDKRIQLVFFRISSANSARIHSAKFPFRFLMFSSCFLLFPSVSACFPRVSACVFDRSRRISLRRRPFRSAKTSLNSLGIQLEIAWNCVEFARVEREGGQTFFTSAAACGTTAAEATDAAAASAQATAVPAISWSRVCVRTPRSKQERKSALAGPVSPLHVARDLC